MSFLNSPNKTFIVSATTVTPPSVPNLLDLYLVPSGSSGAWSTLSDKLVRYGGSSWDSVTPYNGTLVWALDTTTFYIYNSGSSSWTATGTSGSGANTALSNLASVSINTSLLPSSAGTIDLGSLTKPFQFLLFSGASSSPATNNFKLTGTATAGRVITFPDISDTLVSLTATQTLTNKTVSGASNTISGITETMLSFSDITTLNSSTTQHGFLRKLSNVATEYQDGTGNWSVPAGSSGLPFADNTALLKNNSDNTKLAIFNLSAITTGTTRTYALPNTSDTIATLAFAQTFTNKSISGSTNTISGIDETMLSTSDITTLNVSISKHGFAPKAPNDATQFLNGVGGYSTPAGSFSLPVVDTTAIVKGSSDATKLLRFEVDGFTTATTRIATFPDANINVVGEAFSQTLSNKTIDASTNTLSNIAESMFSFSDVTTLNSSTSQHGFLRKLDGVVTNFLNGSGSFSVPAGTGATTALDNLASVAVNSDILAGTAGTISIGSITKPFQFLYFSGASSTPGTNNYKLTGTATAGRTITFKDASYTVVGLDTSDILTNKTLTNSNNTLGGVTVSIGSDATGDTYYRNSGGLLTRLAVSTDGYVYTLNAGLPSWQPAPGGGGGTITGLTSPQLTYATSSTAIASISGATSDGTSVTFGSANLLATSPKITTGISDANGNSMFAFTATTSAIFGFTATNAASGGTVILGTTTPTASTSTIAGTPLRLRASDAVSGTTTTSSAAGGSVEILGGDAKNKTSGNNDGGNVKLTPGLKVASGNDGQVTIGIDGTSTRAAFAFASAPGYGASFVSSGIQFIANNTGILGVYSTGAKFADGQVLAWSNNSSTAGTSEIVFSRFGTNILRIGGDTIGTTAGKLLVSRSDKTMLGFLSINGDDNTTNSIIDLGKFGLDSQGGSTTAGFGSQIQYNLKNSGTNNVTAARTKWHWQTVGGSQGAVFSIGTTSNAVTTDRHVIAPRKTLTNNTATSLFEIALASNSATGGTISATIIASDGTDFQQRVAVVTFGAINKGGTITTSNTVVDDTVNIVSAGTLSDVWTISAGSSKITIQLNANSSLSTTSLYVIYDVQNISESVITIL